MILTRAEEASPRLKRGDPRTWTILALAAGFFALGLVFVVAPRAGAALFGLPAPEGLGLGYVRAIGFRDLALALYMVALTLFASRRALALLLGVTVLIPACDVALLAAITGLARPGHLALHAATGILFAALAIWVARQGRARRN